MSGKGGEKLKTAGGGPLRSHGKAHELLEELNRRGQAPVGREQAPLVMTSALQLYLQEKEREKLVMKDTPFRRFTRIIVESSPFNNVVMAVVLANVIVVALDDHTAIYAYLDLAFFGFFMMEFLMKYYALRHLYWRTSYNIMDFCLIIISLIQLLFQTYLPYINVTYLRVIRALRSISLFRSLQVIVTALARTIRTSVVDVLLLLLLFMFMFANFGYHFFGEGEKEDPSLPDSNFEDMGTAMMTLLVFTTADGWTGRQAPLDKLGYTYNRLFVVLYIFIGNFILQNLFIAVICKAQEAERKLQQQRRKEARQYKRNIVARKQKDELATIMSHQRRFDDSNDMQAMFRALAGQLHHDDITPAAPLCCNIAWMLTYQMTLRYHETAMMRCQQLHFAISKCLAKMADYDISERMDKQ